MFTIDNHGPARKKVSNGTKVQGGGNRDQEKSRVSRAVRAPALTEEEVFLQMIKSTKSKGPA